MSGLAEQLRQAVESPGVTPLAFGLAFAAGAGHAVTPGHGKSLAAAYLVGTRGRIRDAAWIGGSVAVMHTLSVLALGLLWTFASMAELVRMAALTRWLQLGAGLLVLGTGLWLLRRRRVGGHHHPGRRPGLLLLGAAGGLTPSPAAFAVLVTGLFLGRAGFAVLLVLAFGAGMAAVLFGVGLLAVGGGAAVTRGARVHAALRAASRAAPVVAAAGVTLLGAALTAAAAFQLATVL